MQHDPGSPTSWLVFANSDLALAKNAAGPKVLLESLCFHAQQAAEKAIKAVLIHSGIPAPKTHSIERLIDLLPPDVDRIPTLLEAAQLTNYAVISRYPGDEPPIPADEYNDAVRLAEAVVEWAEQIIR